MVSAASKLACIASNTTALEGVQDNDGGGCGVGDGDEDDKDVEGEGPLVRMVRRRMVARLSQLIAGSEADVRDDTGTWT